MCVSRRSPQMLNLIAFCNRIFYQIKEALSSIICRIWNLAVVFLVACSSHNASTDRSAGICDEFGVHLNEPTRLSRFSVEGERTDEGISRISTVDFDGDSINDRIEIFCPGSASLMAADPCSFRATSSATGKSFEIEEQRLYLIKYGSLIYVVAGSMTDEKGPMHTSIYLIDGRGPKRMCSYECSDRSQCIKSGD